MQPLSRKIAIVTGAGRGIGAATAEALADAGARVAIVSRTRVELDEVAERITQKHGAESVLAIRADVSDERAVAELFSDAESKLGSCDILINNAATFVQGELADLELADWERSLRVNL